MKKEAIEIVKKFMPYVKAESTTFFDPNGDERRLLNAKECALIFTNNVKKICPYFSRLNIATIEQFRAKDVYFLDYWMQIEDEIRKLTLDDLKE